MEAILLLALLICPVAMGAMMFVMMRGMRRQGAAHERAQEEEPPVSPLNSAGRGDS
jgi:preprotein translocase subunit YajC